MESWKNGEFGNPVGIQQKVNDLRKFCQNFAPQCMKIIAEMILDPMTEEKNRISLMKFVCEQAYGKTPQSVEVKITDGLSPKMMTSEQLNMFVSGKIQDLVINLHQTGKLDEYLKFNQLSLESPRIENGQAS